MTPAELARVRRRLVAETFTCGSKIRKPDD
jgi:hypothetical protein